MEQMILKTLAYADLFDYPLTKKELWRRLIWERAVKPVRSEFEKSLERLESDGRIQKEAKRGEEYYFLPGRERVVGLRQRRMRESEQKLQIAREVVEILKFCPWVWLIGVTGSVAAQNAKSGDDVDLLVVTAPGRLWLTRFWLIVVLTLLRRRRWPKERQAKNKICLNLFLSADHLDYFAQEKDLFLAYEIVQTQPLLQRYQVYQKFLSANLWVREFLPNSCSFSELEPSHSANLIRSYQINNRLWDVVERIAYQFQLWWMKKRRTRERVAPFLAAFHPKDIRRQILERFRQRSKRFLR